MSMKALAYVRYLTIGQNVKWWVFLMNNLSFRKATDSDREFAYQTKKAAFKEYERDKLQ